MIHAGNDFWANLSTGEWAVIISDNMGVTLQNKSIVIPPVKVLSRDYQDTCIHEAVHASMPNLCETDVARLANDITEVLWKRGYRLEHKKKKRHTKGS